MSQHRCTRCKNDVGQHGIRHKYRGVVYCEHCIRLIRGFIPSRHSGFFGSLWGRITGFINRVVLHRQTVKYKLREDARKRRTQLKNMEAKARNIPANLASSMPQKR